MGGSTNTGSLRWLTRSGHFSDTTERIIDESTFTSRELAESKKRGFRFITPKGLEEHIGDEICLNLYFGDVAKDVYGFIDYNAKGEICLSTLGSSGDLIEFDIPHGAEVYIGKRNRIENYRSYVFIDDSD